MNENESSKQKEHLKEESKPSRFVSEILLLSFLIILIIICTMVISIAEPSAEDVTSSAIASYVTNSLADVK